MGFNNEHARRVIFDIETAPISDAASYLEPVEAPANYKDPVKIAAYQAEKQAEQLEKAALDVDLARVVAVGMWEENHDTPYAVTMHNSDESTLIRAFWAIADNVHLVGYNCLGFDLPMLLRRSLYLGVQIPAIKLERYRVHGVRVTDLMDELSYNGKLRWRSLSFYCKRFGIEVDDPLTGADVGLAVREGRWADVSLHCEADVRKTAYLAAKLGYFTLPDITEVL